jgi:hypothetical protein
MAKRFSLLDIQRMKALSSGTRPANQAANVPDKTDMRARESLTNKVLTQAPVSTLPKAVAKATGVMGLILVPTRAGMGQFNLALLRNRKNLIVIKLREGQ